jgi:hypothetical protein
MKLLLLTCLFFTSTAALAQQHPFMSVKERLRILLWIEGLEDDRVEAVSPEVPKRAELPEEIERALEKM